MVEARMTDSVTTDAILTLSEAAARRIGKLISEKDGGALALRLSVTEQGCSGHAYAFDFAAAPQPGDQVIEDKGVTVFVDPQAVELLRGSEMDFRESAFETGFTFRNPNEKGRCGCGESFYV